MNKEKIFLWAYRTFTYFVPAGFALYTFLIEKLINPEITLMSKLGVSGIFTLVIIFVIAIFFLGKHFKKKIAKVNDQILLCTNNEEKQSLITKRKKTEAKQELFHNILFIAPFILCYLIVYLVEKACLDMRGTLLIVSCSMAVGLGLNGVKQWLYTKEGTTTSGQKNIKKFEEIDSDR